MKKASVGVWILWIVLTILVAGGLVYYYQYTKIPELNSKIDDLQNQINQLNQEKTANQIDETADWKTYTDNTNKFSLKYPSDWSVIQDKVETKSAVAGVPSTFNTSLGIKDQIEFSIRINAEGIGPAFSNKYATIRVSGKKLDLVSLVEKSLTTEARQALDESYPSNSIVFVSNIFSYKNVNYFASYYYPENDKNGEETFRNIISTFQFTN